MLPFEWESDKESWDKEDIIEFQKVLYEYMGTTEEIFALKNSLNTNMDCYAVSEKLINQFANLVLKGNYVDFLEKSTNNCHEMTLIRGKVICGIKNQSLFKKFLDEYTESIDSYGHCDFFEINIDDLTYKFIAENLILDYINSNNVFKKRIAVVLLKNHFMQNNNQIKFSFGCIKYLSKETHYYIFTAIAEFLYECFLNRQSLTIKLLK